MYQNISAYCFAPLADLKAKREELLELGRAQGLKGTILLSTEGINLFIAGMADAVETLVATIRTIPGLEALNPKYSESGEQPFNRYLVRIKKEIISFGVEGIEPSKRTSPKLSAQQLKSWLDEGKPVTLLDTRNDYEFKMGTFKSALTFDMKSFREFPAAVATLPVELKQQPIVMFCTGGIRCEKAGPYMESQGFENIYQLDGGILKYFEEVGPSHFDGECFVFDKRVGVDPALQETPSAFCFVCLVPLTLEDQGDHRFHEGVSCPYCFKSSEEQMRDRIARKHAALKVASNPLPGKEPYANERPFSIPASADGSTVLAFLTRILPNISEEEWATKCASGLIVNDQRLPVAGDQPVRAGERYYHLTPCRAEPDVNASIEILFEDSALVVVNKPAPLPVHPCGRFNKNSLTSLLNLVYAPEVLRPAHRLDANTTGVMILSRTKYVARDVQPQFERELVKKRYLLRVHGHPSADSFFIDSPISESKTIAGGRQTDAEGLAALTEFRVLKRFEDGTSLLEATPKTGRTNQIRVHAWELNLPIVGDQLYLPGKKLGDVQTADIEDQPLCLHAQSIAFRHPQTKEPVCFETPEPSWSIG